MAASRRRAAVRIQAALRGHIARRRVESLVVEETRAVLEGIERRLAVSMPAARDRSERSNWAAGLPTPSFRNTPAELNEQTPFDDIVGCAWAMDLLALGRAPPPPPGTLLSRPRMAHSAATHPPLHPLYAVCGKLLHPSSLARDECLG